LVLSVILGHSYHIKGLNFNHVSSFSNCLSSSDCSLSAWIAKKCPSRFSGV